MTELTACTIVSKNYLAFARVLAHSFLEHHPDGRFVVLLVDRIDGYFDPASEPFRMVQVEELANIPDIESLLFKYSILEANTAVKPFFLEHLLSEAGVEKLVYFDPDIQVFRNLGELGRLLDGRAIVLTPHLTAPIEDDHYPDEQAILRAGAYNLGFLALADRPPVREFLGWWQSRVADRCVVRVEEGLFVDQKWIDLVPGLYPGVAILRQAGYNVAYWNLHCRQVSVGEEIRVNGEPLCFFHFSGLDPDYVDVVSRHQDRFSLDELGDERELFEAYVEMLRANGFEESRRWPYAFSTFDSGVTIPHLARSLYLSMGDGARAYPNPFATAGEGSFWSWCNGPARGRRPPYLSRLLHFLWESEAELQASFPDPFGKDLRRFAEWLDDYGRDQYGLPAEALAPAAPLSSKIGPLTALRKGTKRTAKRLYVSAAGQKIKAWVKERFGDQSVRAIKRRFRPLAHGHASLQVAPGLSTPAGEFTSVGINLTGYVRAESGMGEGARSLIRAMEAVGLPHTVADLDLNVLSRMDDHSAGEVSGDYEYGINLFVVNADQVGAVMDHVGPGRLKGRHNVGFWLWEQEHFPRRWLRAFDHFCELWTPSRFCMDALSAVAPVPVRRVPLTVEAKASSAASRTNFELPQEAFLVLFIFDFLSYFERKNPIALVRAFRKAFGDREDVVLVLKTANSQHNPEALAALEREMTGVPVRLIDRYLSRQEIFDLMAVCDCYASLHRSEGFGLTIAEAMSLGKPVVATDYSGNTDFMHPGNSLPVGYELVTLERDSGPYARGSLWADPDVDHAAELLRRIHDDRDLASRLGERARRDVSAQLSSVGVGGIMRERVVDMLRRTRRGFGLTHPAAPPR